MTKNTDIFVEIMREAAKASQNFSTKYIGKFQKLTFKILMKL